MSGDDLTPEFLARCRERATELGMGDDEIAFFFGQPLTQADLDDLADEHAGLFDRFTLNPNRAGHDRQPKEGG